MNARKKLIEYLASNTDMLTPQQSQRVEALRESPAPSSALALARGCMAVPVAEILRDELQEEIDTEEAMAAWQREWYDRPDLAAKHEAQALKLRRQMEEWNLRQPPYNSKDEPDVQSL